MTKKEYYGLEFIKLNQNGKNVYYCRRKDGIVDNYSELQFINRLSVVSTQFLIGDIADTVVSQNAIRDYTQPGGCDHIDLEIAYPNFIIDEILSLPLVDMKALLEEWLLFLQS